MSKVRIDSEGAWSGGGSVVIANAREAAQKHPRVFSSDAGAAPLYFRNSVPLRLLATGRFFYMPQNAWPWAGLATTLGERTRRAMLRVLSDLALHRTRGALRTGPSVPASGRTHPAVLMNPLDAAYEQALADAPARPTVTVQGFFCVGSCWGYRNLPTLLAGYEQYRQLGGWRPLVLATAGPRAKAMRRRAGDGVVFVDGKLTRPDLIATMRASQAVVFPSSVEASPITLLEAAAAGCRIAMSDIPGHTAAMQSVAASGVLTWPAFDAQQLAQQLVALDADDQPVVTSRLDTAEGRGELRDQWCTRFAEAIEQLAA